MCCVRAQLPIDSYPVNNSQSALAILNQFLLLMFRLHRWAGDTMCLLFPPAPLLLHRGTSRRILPAFTPETPSIFVRALLAPQVATLATCVASIASSFPKLR